tara:strand:+ start:188 stop:745 length:558 start_codon:yes stop_codon:yes gene_type:complete
MEKLRIKFATRETIKDEKIVAAIEHSAKEGTPRAESQAIRARVPGVFWSFQNAWNDVFKEGIVDHSLKELCRIYVSKSVDCKYCGNQRSSLTSKNEISENDYIEILNFEKSDLYTKKSKAALALTEAITWDLPTDDKFWERLYNFFSEDEIVEIGFFVGLTMGQQRFNRILNLDSHLGETEFGES